MEDKTTLGISLHRGVLTVVASLVIWQSIYCISHVLLATELNVTVCLTM